MWIEIPKSLQSIKPPGLDENVELGDGTKVQVTKEAGELLVEKYDAISEHTKED